MSEQIPPPPRAWIARAGTIGEEVDVWKGITHRREVYWIVGE